ncbi:heat shock cognate 70 kDa protein-like [Carex rostrata]
MQLKENAQKKLEATITNAVITVPFHFNYRQRQAIKEAGMIAGLNFMQIISAPAASAMFYGIEKQPSKSWNPWSPNSEHNMIIYHVGSGTLDVVLVTIKDSKCKVRAAAGNLHLSGPDFDNTTVAYFVNTLTDMCLKDASMRAYNVHEVILAGGSTWITLLQSYIHQYFKYKELNIREQLETTTAYGAAIQAFFCDNRGACYLSLLDVTPFSLGIQSPRGKMVVCVPKNTNFPTNIKKLLHTSNLTKNLFFEVYEGELIIENNLLGKFELSEVPTMCKFSITFDIHETASEGSLSLQR